MPPIRALAGRFRKSVSMAGIRDMSFVRLIASRDVASDHLADSSIDSPVSSIFAPQKPRELAVGCLFLGIPRVWGAFLSRVFRCAGKGRYAKNLWSYNFTVRYIGRFFEKSCHYSRLKPKRQALRLLTLPTPGACFPYTLAIPVPVGLVKAAAGSGHLRVIPHPSSPGLSFLFFSLFSVPAPYHP